MEEPSLHCSDHKCCRRPPQHLQQPVSTSADVHVCDIKLLSLASDNVSHVFYSDTTFLSCEPTPYLNKKCWYQYRHAALSYRLPDSTVCMTPLLGGFPRSIARQPRGCHYRTMLLRDVYRPDGSNASFDAFSILTVRMSSVEKMDWGV